MKKNILNFVLIFLIVILVVNSYLKPKEEQGASAKKEISLTPVQKEFGQKDLVSAEIKNNTDQVVTLKNECPQEPLDVFRYINGEWTKLHKTAVISCAETKDLTLKPGEKYLISYNSWNYALFHDLGRYKLTATVLMNAEEKTIESPEFEIKPQGIFSYLWTTLFYQPLYNILILLISIAPGKDLGLAIILLTMIIRTILLIPSQNALKSQRKMQEIQPKLNKIREKYKNNQEMIAKESMAIWKEHKVNPLGSCLPLVIQFPVFIAIFYVVREGLNPDNSYLLYDFLKNFSFENINVNFLGILDLTKINLIMLPLIVGGLQFLQMKLTTSGTKKPDENKQEAKKTKSEMEIATGTMTYIMPVIVAIFTASVPAGVGLYYATSTIYGIIQQLVVNKQSTKGKAKVKVLPDSPPQK
jgi:YidC/Oxa1 family membrane protein insertase